MLYNCMRSFILKYGIVLDLQMILHTDLEQAVDAWITAWALSRSRGHNLFERIPWFFQGTPVKKYLID